MVERKKLIGIIVAVVVIGSAVGVGAWYSLRKKGKKDYWNGGTVVVDWCKAVPAEQDVALIFKKSVNKLSDRVDGLQDLDVKLVKTPWSSMIEESGSQDASPNIQTTFVAAHYGEAGSLLKTRYHSSAADTWEQNEWLLNDTIDQAIENSIAIVDPQARKQAYQDVQEMIMKKQPSLCLFDHYMKIGYQDYVEWPQGKGNRITGIMGFDQNLREINVTSAKGDTFTAYFSFGTKPDPAKGSDFSSSTTFTNTYDPLVFPKPGGGIMPWVAKDWSIGSEGLTYNFTIRDGIKFHTGGEVTPEDVYYSMKRMKKIKQGYAYLFNKVNMTKSEYWNEENKVKFVLSDTYGPFVSTLERLNIVDKDAVTAHDEGWLMSHDAGSGPYTITDVNPANHVYFEKVDNYWAYDEFDFITDENKPSTVKFKKEAGTSTVVTQMKSQEIEMTSQWLPPTATDELAETEGIHVGTIPGGDEFFFMMHNRKKPTDSLHLRKALAYAMDYKKVVKKAYPGNKVSYSSVPSYLFGYKNCSDILPDRDRNLDKAAEEIKKSKYWTGPTAEATALSQSSIVNWVEAVMRSVNPRGKIIVPN